MYYDGNELTEGQRALIRSNDLNNNRIALEYQGTAEGKHLVKYTIINDDDGGYELTRSANLNFEKKLQLQVTGTVTQTMRRDTNTYTFNLTNHIPTNFFKLSFTSNFLGEITYNGAVYDEGEVIDIVQSESSGGTFDAVYKGLEEGLHNISFTIVDGDQNTATVTESLDFIMPKVNQIDFDTNQTYKTVTTYSVKVVLDNINTKFGPYTLSITSDLGLAPNSQKTLSSTEIQQGYAMIDVVPLHVAGQHELIASLTDNLGNSISFTSPNKMSVALNTNWSVYAFAGQHNTSYAGLTIYPTLYHIKLGNIEYVKSFKFKIEVISNGGNGPSSRSQYYIDGNGDLKTKPLIITNGMIRLLVPIREKPERISFLVPFLLWSHQSS